MPITHPKTHLRLRLNEQNKGTDEMIKNSILAALVAFGLGTGAANAAGTGHTEDFAFSFEGQSPVPMSDSLEHFKQQVGI